MTPARMAGIIGRRCVRAAAPLLRPLEAAALARAAGEAPRHPIVFIIGAPRSGSTILYQALTQYLRVAYITNLACWMHRNLLLGMALSQWLLRGRAHDTDESSFGVVAGWRSPAECGEFWYQWLPRDRHFVDEHETPAEAVRTIRAHLVAIVNHCDQPLVIKNLNAGQRMRLLARAVPEARFIHCEREPLWNAQSILQARRINHTPDDGWWSIMPPNYRELLQLEVPERVVGQIHSIERQIWLDRARFPAANFVVVDHEVHGRELRQTVTKLRERVLENCAWRQPVDELRSVHRPEWRLGSPLRERVEAQIKRLDWSFREAAGARL